MKITRALRPASRAWVAAVLGGLAGCSEDPGRIELTVAWPDRGGAPAQVFLRGEVRLGDRDGVVQAEPVGPVDFGGEAALRFDGVPNGRGHVIVVEVVATPDAEVVLFFGASEPFDLQPGQTTRVTVPLSLARPPQIDVGTAALALDGGRDLVNDADVTLVLTTDTAAVVELSNLPGFVDDVVSVELSGADGGGASCPPTPGTGAGEVCTYRVPWNLDRGLAAPCVGQDFCLRQIFARFRDASGFRSEAVSTTATLDTRPPSIVAAAAQYAPGPDSVLSSVDAAADGSEICVSVNFSEPVTTAQAVAFNATSGGSTMVFDDLEPESATTTFLSACTIVDRFAHADGDYTIAVQISDLAGNVNPAATSDGFRFVVDATADGLFVDQDAVSFVRSPAGRPVAELTESDTGELGYVIPPGPTYFALAPADPLDIETALPLGTFALGAAGGPTPTLLRVWADDRKVNLLKSIVPGPDGWDRDALQLANLDTNQAFVTGVDGAGNESTPVGIRSTWFVAASGPTDLGERPHELGSTSIPSAPLAPFEPVVGPDGSAPDGAGVIRSAEAAWTRVRAANPGTRGNFGLAMDTGRDRLVLFGGQGRSDTWEFDGQSWRDVTPSTGSPSPRVRPGLVYDSRRGRVLLHGGNGATDTWSWDGTRWTQIPTAHAPTERTIHGMSYDSRRDRVVVFGGSVLTTTVAQSSSETWEFDGADWIDRTADTSTRPPARFGHEMAYDASRGVTVLFGGVCGPPSARDNDCDDTWEWDGDDWTRRTPAARPPARGNHVMAYDSARQRVVIRAGTSFLPDGSFENPRDAWAFDGTTWTEIASPSTPPGYVVTSEMVDDPARGRLLHYAGFPDTDSIQAGVVGFEGTTWALDGDLWTRINDRLPAARRNGAMVYDAARAEIVLFGGARIDSDGGRLNDTWTWDGSRWTERRPFPPFPPPPAPSPRERVAIGYDRVRERVLLFGGRDADGNRLGDTWAWDGAGWSAVATSTAPSPRFGARMAWDPTRQQLILFGGNVATEIRFFDPGIPGFPPSPISVAVFGDETWAWDGATWSRIAPAERPPGFGEHELVLDEARGRVVLHGGDSVQCDEAFCPQQPQETWEWDGATWTQVSTSVLPTGDDFGRREFGMTYDPRRERVVLFGGSTTFFVEENDEVYEWDGAVWRELAPAPGGPFPRFGTQLMHHVATGQTLMFGGWFLNGGMELFEDAWLLELPDRPAAQFAPRLPSVPDDAWRELRVRAYCGGEGEAGTGATAYAWRTRGQPGAWEPLATNTQGLAFSSADPEASKMDVTVDAARYLGPGGRMYLQCRPEATSGVGTASVAVDYFEIRARYELE